MECIKYVIASQDMSPRIAAELCSAFGSYDDGIYLCKDSRKCNAKSMLGIMSLNIRCGDSVEISARGNSRNALPVIDQAIKLL